MARVRPSPSRKPWPAEKRERKRMEGPDMWKSCDIESSFSSGEVSSLGTVEGLGSGFRVRV